MAAEDRVAGAGAGFRQTARYQGLVEAERA
jgi:hypothetical protein